MSQCFFCLSSPTGLCLGEFVSRLFSPTGSGFVEVTAKWSDTKLRWALIGVFNSHFIFISGFPVVLASRHRFMESSERPFSNAVLLELPLNSWQLKGSAAGGLVNFYSMYLLRKNKFHKFLLRSHFLQDVIDILNCIMQSATQIVLGFALGRFVKVGVLRLPWSWFSSNSMVSW